MPATLLEDNIVDDLEATSLPEEEAAPDDEVESEVEQESEPNPYEGKTREEIEELIAAAARDAEAKARKSESDKAATARAAEEAERNRQQFIRDQQAAQSLVNGQAKRDIVDGVQQLIELAVRAEREGTEPPQINGEWIDRVVTGFRAGLRNADTAEWTNTANAYFASRAPQGWAPAQELVVQAAKAQTMYGKAGWLDAALQMAESIGAAKAVAQDAARKAEDERVKGLEGKSGRQPGPTGAGGATPAARNAREVISDAITSEEDDRKNWAAAFPGVPYPR